MKDSLKNRLKSDAVFDMIVNFLGGVIVLIVLIPLIFVLAASFSDPDLVIRGEVLLWPKGFTLEAYKMVFENEDIWKGFINSCFYTGVGTLISIILTIMAAYPLSRKGLEGRRIFMLLILFTMYFSGGMIPTYLLVKNLGLYDTRWALLIPAALSTYNLIVAKTFFENSIPEELYESARLDGCGNLQMLLKIVLPLSKAILAVLVLYYAVEIWNAYFDALIYIRNADLHPLQIVLRNILLLGQTEQMGTNDVGMAEKVKMAEAVKYSAIVISSVPMLLIYPFVQKHFVKGVMIGAVKG
ncbi:MAG TPA: carbohydrate ABC transporter permease [Candidatus Eisenbergiella merdavium]|uniref:Carbohydrate ABC transporter permease n=1 Tax=Candidatus Eisenbergiella merdavium TaxID=2838551 RepID=A0A9D2ND12_9FIRM|nr:carbohydrate ABC transporter permease [Candidatus Eisenbergiella merdavium]